MEHAPSLAWLVAAAQTSLAMVVQSARVPSVPTSQHHDSNSKPLALVRVLVPSLALVRVLARVLVPPRR